MLWLSMFSGFAVLARLVVMLTRFVVMLTRFVVMLTWFVVMLARLVVMLGRFPMFPRLAVFGWLGQHGQNLWVTCITRNECRTGMGAMSPRNNWWQSLHSLGWVGGGVRLSCCRLDSKGDLKPLFVASPSGALDFHAM